MNATPSPISKPSLPPQKQKLTKPLAFPMFGNLITFLCSLFYLRFPSPLFLILSLLLALSSLSRVGRVSSLSRERIRSIYLLALVPISPVPTNTRSKLLFFTDPDCFFLSIFVTFSGYCHQSAFVTLTSHCQILCQFLPVTKSTFRRITVV